MWPKFPSLLAYTSPGGAILQPESKFRCLTCPRRPGRPLNLIGRARFIDVEPTLGRDFKVDFNVDQFQRGGWW